MKPIAPISELKGEAILLLAAILWGVSFVFQRMSVATIGAFGFNGFRYPLAALALLPLAIGGRARSKATGRAIQPLGRSLLYGAGGGLIMFAGASLQQIGIADSTAGKAGFITGLYVVLVPVLGIFLKKRTGAPVWAGAVMAVIGLYFLSMSHGFSMGRGDLTVLAGSLLWAMHILYLDAFSTRADPLVFAATQALACGILSLGSAAAFEGISLSEARATLMPILYSGIVSIGGGFTLQILGQRRARASRASIILSLEALFAAVFGALILRESFTPRMGLGAALILGGMVVSQIERPRPGPGKGGPRVQDAAGRA